MSTELENLKAELAALAGRIAALETVEQPEAEWPKIGDTYFFVDGDGDVMDSQWGSDLFDASRMNIGNVYRSVAEADHESERRKVLTELRRLAKASWNKEPVSCAYFSLRFTREGGPKVCIYSYPRRELGVVYFATEKAAEAAIETIGADRLMLLED